MGRVLVDGGLRAESAVFSGAGLSAASPAGLPLGLALRDEVLGFLFDEATGWAGDLVTRGQVERLSGPERKLEQVLGRLWRVTGSDALECLRCLQVTMPNRGHMLAAVHLARGGTHVTVNIDRGIELAYGLIAGTTEIPPGWSSEYGDALVAWRSAFDAEWRPLRVVASRREFDRWVDDGLPPALLKVHGSLPAGDGVLVDVVVEDTEELGGLAPSRRTAVEQLGDRSILLITGYGGLDPDVYRPLLRAARRTHAVWATKTIDEESKLQADVVASGINLRTGDPDGLAATVLAELVDVAIGWPDATPADEASWQERFSQWREVFRVQHPPAQFAVAWAWLLADTGDRDAAITLLERLAFTWPDSATLVRLADALYDRAEGNDRRHASRLYWSRARDRRTEWGLRGHCLLRLGGIARGRAVREAGWRKGPDLLVALAVPLVVLAEQRRRGRRKDPELSAAANATLGQTILRGCEGLLLSCPSSALPLVGAGLRHASAICGNAADASTNGNRRALASSHRLLALALASLVTGEPPQPPWTEELDDLVAAYVNAGDLAGAGNCYSALAVIAAASNDWAHAASQLDSARTFYAEGRQDHRLIPSGAALVTRLERLFGDRERYRP